MQRLILLLTLVAYLIGLPAVAHAHGHASGLQAAAAASPDHAGAISAAGEHQHQHGGADCEAEGGCFSCPCPVMPYAGIARPFSPIEHLEFIARQETERPGIVDLPVRPPRPEA